MVDLIQQVIKLIVLLLEKIYDRFWGYNLFCSPQKIKVGVIEPSGIENYHHMLYIQNNILQDKDNILIIGSPHLKYWFETIDEPRMLTLLRSTSCIKVSVNLYKSKYNDENVINGLMLCKSKYEDRFFYKLIDESSSISYIYYWFKIKKKIYSRCIVGYQGTKYRDRPFIEFISQKGLECDFVKSILDSHEIGRDSNDQDSAN